MIKYVNKTIEDVISDSKMFRVLISKYIINAMSSDIIKFCPSVKDFINSLFRLLSSTVARMSVPGCLEDIDDGIMSDKPVAVALTFAPNITYLFENKSGDKLGFFPCFIKSYSSRIWTAEIVLWE